MFKFKKYISVFVCLILLLITVLGNHSFTASAETVTTAYIQGTNVNVRKDASTSSEKVDQLSMTSATVIGSKTNSKGELWYQISYIKSNATVIGYIFYDSSYIKIVTTDLSNPNPDFETQLKAFPESYHAALRSLKAQYPNWNFIADNVAVPFYDMVNIEIEEGSKQVSGTSHPISWRSMGEGVYNWNTNTWHFNNDGWTGASREIVAYYMDPRNFLNSSEIYMFLQQSYNPAYQNEEGLNKIIAGSFLENGYSDPKDTAYNGSYVKVIMEAAKQANINPYIIASKIIQEQGTSGTSDLISGKKITVGGSTFESCYNFFNFKASGGTTQEVVKNGLLYAQKNGWVTRSASIIGGAKVYSEGYISAGQDTYYYQDYNVLNPNEVWHQYAQAVHDARSKGISLAKTYQADPNISLSFRIPVFSGMPASAVQKPVQNSSKNNYYFKEISVSELSPSFSMYNYDYTLEISKDTALKYVLPTGAKLVSAEKISLAKGITDVVLKVESETGYTNDYTISVKANNPCNLFITTDGKIPNDGSSVTPPVEPDEPDEPVTPPAVPTYRLGDVNNDGKISISDLGNIRLHLLGRYTLTGNNALAADINKDGKISISDLGNVRLHLLGRYTIKD